MTALPYVDWLSGRPVSYRRLRRLSRQYESVGVRMPATRLAEIAAGAPAASAELVDISFAQLAIRMRGDQQHGKLRRVQQRCARWALVVGAALVALNLLLAMGLVFYLLTQQAPGL